MRKEIVTVPCVSVMTPEHTETRWFSDDGKQFPTEQDCLSYEGRTTARDAYMALKQFETELLNGAEITHFVWIDKLEDYDTIITYIMSKGSNTQIYKLEDKFFGKSIKRYVAYYDSSDYESSWRTQYTFVNMERLLTELDTLVRCLLHGETP